MIIMLLKNLPWNSVPSQRFIIYLMMLLLVKLHVCWAVWEITDAVMQNARNEKSGAVEKID